MKKAELQMIKNGKRLDGRKLDEMRPTKIEAGVLENADGSCYIEMGKTKVLAGVFGPKEFHPKHKQNPQTGVLNCRYRMAAFSTEDRIRPGPNRRSTEISMVTANALTPSLFLKNFPKTMIELTVEVLQADASTRVAGINAASVALADAGIPMRDLVTSVAVGKVEGQLLLDVAGKEDTLGETDFPVAMMPRSRKITLMQLDGHLTKDEFKTSMKLANKGIDAMHALQVKALQNRYSKDIASTKEVAK